MTEEHPARRVGVLSQRYVAAGEREKWLVDSIIGGKWLNYELPFDLGFANKAD